MSIVHSSFTRSLTTSLFITAIVMGRYSKNALLYVFAANVAAAVASASCRALANLASIEVSSRSLSTLSFLVVLVPLYGFKHGLLQAEDALAGGGVVNDVFRCEGSPGAEKPAPN